MESANEDGIIGVGGNLAVNNLLNAYAQGIFPWPINKEYPLVWFSPNPRGILFTKDFHLQRSLKKLIKKKYFKVWMNVEFEKVISLCATVHKKRSDETWITDEMIKAYTNLHKHGHAYCITVTDSLNQIVGGLYGVNLMQMVTAESMFFITPNASKIALYALVNHLQKYQISWIDIQMVSPILKQLGGIELERGKFKLLLSKSLEKPMLNRNVFLSQELLYTL